MSWNGVLPWWFYDMEYEHFLASCSCCFREEWYSGISRVVPEYIVQVIAESRYSE